MKFLAKVKDVFTLSPSFTSSLHSVDLTHLPDSAQSTTVKMEQTTFRRAERIRAMQYNVE